MTVTVGTWTAKGLSAFFCTRNNMKVIYEYFINASIQDFIFGVILAAIIIRIVLDILI